MWFLINGDHDCHPYRAWQFSTNLYELTELCKSVIIQYLTRMKHKIHCFKQSLLKQKVVFALLGRWGAQVASWSPTFRDNISAPSSRAKQPSWTTRRTTQEEGRPELHRGRSLKSRKVTCMVITYGHRSLPCYCGSNLASTGNQFCRCLMGVEKQISSAESSVFRSVICLLFLTSPPANV